MLGRLWLRLHEKYRYGLVAAYWRDYGRRSILATRPITQTEDRHAEIHVLTCASDWINTLWTLKSFYTFSGRKYSLCIHEDGSLGMAELEVLRSHFPNARVIDRPTAERMVTPTLTGKPLSQRFRSTNPLALKVFDFIALLNSERMVLLDSDLLFFCEPSALIQRIEDADFRKNSLNRDWTFGYSMPMENLQALVPGIQPGLNSGLGVIHRDSVNFERIEEWLGQPAIWSHSHRIEQTLIALYSFEFGHEFLPVEYDVHLGPFAAGSPVRHFTGPIRHLMYSGGMRYLFRSGFTRRIAGAA